MLSDLSKYGFINAKIRSKIGNIFNQNDLDHFRNELKYYDLVNVLVEKNYINEKDLSVDNAVENLEYLLVSHLINIFEDILSDIQHKTIKKFTTFLLQKYEIRNLKNILRLWYKKDVSLMDYIYQKKIVHSINYEALFSAEDLNAILDILEGTPYYDILKKEAPQFKEKNSLFQLETALDKYYYDLIFSHLHLLNKRDQKIIKKFYGFEIDIKNFLLMMRFKNYYDLDVETFLKHLIPSGYKTNTQMFKEIYQKDEVSMDLFNIFSGLPEYISKDITKKLGSELNLKNKMMLVNDILNEFMLIEIRNTLGHYPFTVGIIIVYLLLKELEINSVISILNLKYYDII